MPHATGWRSFTVAAVFASALAAQVPSAAPEGLPEERGVFYRVGPNWEPLSRTEFLPLPDGELRSFLSIGRRHLVGQVSGPQALIRSNRKPVFYIRGFSPADGIYLVRTRARREFRAVKMTMDRRISDGPHFRSEDLVPFDLAAAGFDVITLTPRTDLAPGEYVIVTAVGASYRWLHFAYGFGVGSGTP
jgi:hypothetical protein